MKKHAVLERTDRTLTPHNKQVKLQQEKKRFSAEERKRKEAEQRTLGGF